MKIYYSPTYSEQCYLDISDPVMGCNTLVANTQGLLSQLALHTGIHVETPSFHHKLTAYFHALCKYDKDHPENLFHRSIEIDAMSVAKSLLTWRDELSLCGWNSNIIIDGCSRINVLAEIEHYYQDNSISVLLKRLLSHLNLTKNSPARVPSIFSNLEIIIPCKESLLPDYIKPLLTLLQEMEVKVTEYCPHSEQRPVKVTKIEFSQLWKAEAWLSQLDKGTYDVWINTNNKRLDNWLHMSGKQVSGSTMLQSNPQITQLFLLAVQLFKRPLNVNTLIQYLLLPECPLEWKLRHRLAETIIREGGFCNQKVKENIRLFIEKEYKEDNDNTPCELTSEQRSSNYKNYLPFDLLSETAASDLATENEDVSTKEVIRFIRRIRNFSAERAIILSTLAEEDVRIEQLQTVTELADALLYQLDIYDQETLQVKNLLQWAQSLYEAQDYCQYHAQCGSRFVISAPGNMISPARKAIWCDFFGDPGITLSTDFLSPVEQEKLKAANILLWNRDHEKEYLSLLQSKPLQLTEDELTLVVSKQNGASILPLHPLTFQISDAEIIDGDALYANMMVKEAASVQNFREEDKIEVTFDAKTHPVKFPQKESFSSLEKLLQNPLDYFMHYCLGFTEENATEIKLSTTYGNVAHEVIEQLFTQDRGEESLSDFVSLHYQEVVTTALGTKGALLLLPEHHLDKDRFVHLLQKCVDNLAAIISNNRLSVVSCEQFEEQDLGFPNVIGLSGYIDILLKDSNGQDVIFDLKWTSVKDKYKKLLESNRAAQLAIYQAMLQSHSDSSRKARTAFFVMPQGELITTDDFTGDHVVYVNTNNNEIMQQIRVGFETRIQQINSGRLETADEVPLKELDYANTIGVFPLEAKGTKTAKKVENKYSPFKCFIEK